MAYLAARESYHGVSIYVTDYATMVLEPGDLDAAGAKFGKSGKPKNGEAKMLDRLLTLYTRDCWDLGLAP